MKDFFSFKKLATPIIIQILFWMGISVWLFKIYGFINELRLGQSNIIGAVTLIVVWPLTLRLYCEIIMLLFKINENLVMLNQKKDS